MNHLYTRFLTFAGRVFGTLARQPPACLGVFLTAVLPRQLPHTVSRGGKEVDSGEHIAAASKRKAAAQQTLVLPKQKQSRWRTA